MCLFSAQGQPEGSADLGRALPHSGASAGTAGLAWLSSSSRLAGTCCMADAGFLKRTEAGDTS